MSIPDKKLGDLLSWLVFDDQPNPETSGMAPERSAKLVTAVVEWSWKALSTTPAPPTFRELGGATSKKLG